MRHPPSTRAMPDPARPLRRAGAPGPWRLPVALPALAALALAGCGADSARVLARVGGRTITTDEFLEAARDHPAQYAGPPDSAKALLLDDLVRRALVLCDAERLGMYRDTALARYRGQVANEALLQTVYDQLAPEDVPVSEGEVEQLYAWRDSAAHVRAILCASRGAAEAALAELGRGAGFAEVADRFGALGAVPAGGDLGYLAPGSLVTPLDRYLRQAPLHTVIGPVESPGEGWFLLEVLERARRTQAPLEAQRAILRDMLRQRKVRALRLRAFRALREAYDVRLEPGGAQAMFAYFNQPEAERGGRDLEAPDSAQRAIVLARYDAGGASGAYTFGEAIADLRVYGREKPNVAMIPSLEGWIERQAVRRVALLEARRRRLDEEPRTLRAIQNRVDNYVLDAYYETEISPGVEASPEDVREAYERTKESFQRLDQVDLLEVTLRDSAAAAELVAHAGHAPSLREAVAMAAPGAPVREERVRYPDAPERWKPYQAAFMQTSPHECLGPLAVAGGWQVVQMVSKQQGPQAFDQLPPAIVQGIRQQATEISRDRTFNHVTDRLRREFNPEVHLERLRALPWPVAPARAG